MIQLDKYQQSLRALNVILTRARWMAHEGGQEELAALLDAAEILPKYIAQPNDATDDYRMTIEAIAEQFPECSQLREDFERDCACAW